MAISQRQQQSLSRELLNIRRQSQKAWCVSKTSDQMRDLQEEPGALPR